MPGPLGIYHGQFATTTDSRDFGLGASNLSLNIGSWYLSGYAGEASNQFVQHVQTKVREVAGQANAVCNYNPTTDRVGLYLNAAANLVFYDPALANICGFSNGTTQPSSVTHIGNAHPRYTWRPSRAVADVPVDTAIVWQPRSATLSSRSPDGTTYTVPGGTVYEAVIKYRCLPAEEVITPAAGTVYLDFQQWFEDVPAAGRPFRYVMNRDKYTAAAADYVTAIWGSPDGEDIGALRDHASRRIASYQGLWDVTVPMYKKV